MLSRLLLSGNKVSLLRLALQTTKYSLTLSLTKKRDGKYKNTSTREVSPLLHRRPQLMKTREATYMSLPSSSSAEGVGAREGILPSLRYSCIFRPVSSSMKESGSISWFGEPNVGAILCCH